MSFVGGLAAEQGTHIPNVIQMCYATVRVHSHYFESILLPPPPQKKTPLLIQKQGWGRRAVAKAVFASQHHIPSPAIFVKPGRVCK